MALAEGRVAATLRIVMSTPSTRSILPCEEEFPTEIAALRGRQGPRLVEFSRVAIDPNITNTSFKTTLYGALVRAAFVVSWAAGLDYALVAVHERVSVFYRRMIGFEPIGRSSSFGIITEPTELLGCSAARLLKRAAQRSAFFQPLPGEIEYAQSLLQQFFPALSLSEAPAISHARLS